ncbi:sodium-dependent nutrient amino acid transporter 1 [Anabrus simplex]|uniref:sodium-dependent nutrient amino acid transporter 1 n=1 Tax=Anabrus simplex TaxID=316456 RepID=UPI0035A2BAAE
MKWRSRGDRSEEVAGRAISFYNSSHEEGPVVAQAGVFRVLDDSAPSEEKGNARQQFVANVSKPESEPKRQPQTVREDSVRDSGRSVRGAMTDLRLLNPAPVIAPAVSSEPALGRSGSPASSSNGSSYYLSETSAEGALRATPMGSTTGLIDSSSLHSTFKVGCRWMPTLASSIAALSLAASFGNIVRLPRIVAYNGGGPFLLAYIGIMIVFGIPLVFLEIGLGQFCQDGTTKLWRAIPLFKGVGYVKLATSLFVAFYYPVLMAISLFYMIWCVKGPVPFSECIFKRDDGVVLQNNGVICLRDTFLKSYDDEEFMWFGVNIALLFLLWALCMLCIFKNKHSYKIAASVVLTPIIVCLILLLLHNLLWDKPTRGLSLLLTFDWNILLDIKVWYFATIQMFFSTQLGFGNLTTCAGKIYSKHNAIWVAILYVVLNLLIGIASVCIVYLWIGQLESVGHEVSTEILPDSIPETFIYTLVYDVAIYCIGNIDKHWLAVVYFTFLCGGFASMFALLYTAVQGLVMEIRKWEWWHVSGCVCIIGFIIGIVLFVPSQLMMVHVIDHYVVGRMALASTALEVIGFAWIYGCGSLYNDFEFILGQKLNFLWKVIWFITPLLLIMLEIWSVVDLPLKGASQNYDDHIWVFALGWGLYALMWIIFICTAIHQILSQVDYNFAQKCISSLKPSRNWGPVDTITRHRWIRWKDWNNKEGHKDFSLKRQGTKDYTASIRKGNTPLTTYRTTVQISNGSFQNNRNSVKEPFKIKVNEADHVCWRGGTRKDDNLNT